MANTGKLYLIPTPLGDAALHTIPPYTIQQLHQLHFFIVERTKTARQFISSTKPPHAIQSLHFQELNKHTPPEVLSSFLQPAREGKDIGLLSEAGCPGVADPGAAIVHLAHEEDIQVVPLVGPSSILLALMASGMNGQSFCFQGYLPPKKPDLVKKLKQLEQNAQRYKQTQLFIETPYRNMALIETALDCLSANTRLGIAADLSLATEYIASDTIAHWRKKSRPELHKRPAIFLIA